MLSLGTIDEDRNHAPVTRTLGYYETIFYQLFWVITTKFGLG